MTALEIAMAGCLAFGQPTGNYYEAITRMGAGGDAPESIPG
jgi:hypothetical protein